MTNVANTENVANNVANEKVQHSRKISLDDFMRDVAPYMRKGWIAMDRSGHWCYFKRKPKKWKYACVWEGGNTVDLSVFLNIKSLKDWTQSLRRVG